MDYNYASYASRNISRFLDTTGDGTGNIDAAVNGSVTPVNFKIVCPEGSLYVVNKLTTLIVDTGTFDTGAYGNALVLTNGVRSIAKINGVEYDRTSELPIKTNIDWAAYHYLITHLTFGSGDEALLGNYTFSEDGKPLILQPGDEYMIRIMDDLSTLTRQTHRAGVVAYTLP